MQIRTIALAAFVPLLAATACKTGSAQKGSSSQAQTSSTDPRRDSQDEGQTPAQARTGSETPTGRDGSASGQGSQAGESSDTSRAGSSGAYGSTGWSSSASTDPLMQEGPAVKAHSDDEIVAGRVTKVSTKSVEIRSAQGDAKTLQIVPETSVKIDGHDARQSDLKEGQEVRASFSNVEGKDVAVEIQAGHGMGSGSSDSMHPSGSMDRGSGSSETGPSSSGSPGASDTSGTSGSDRKY